MVTPSVAFKRVAIALGVIGFGTLIIGQVVIGVEMDSVIADSVAVREAFQREAKRGLAGDVLREELAECFQKARYTGYLLEGCQEWRRACEMELGGEAGEQWRNGWGCEAWRQHCDKTEPKP